MITVGSAHMRGTAARSDDTVNLFSSRGPTRGARERVGGGVAMDNLLKPDLVAPGNRLIAAGATSASLQWNAMATQHPALLQGLGNFQTQNRTLMLMSGTSVSAPVVAGAAAVLLQANPGLTPPLVKAILQYSAQPLPGAALVEQGAGLLNLDGAVRLARALRTDIADRVFAGTIGVGNKLNLDPAVDRSLPRQVLAVLDQSGPEGPHRSGEHAAHPIEPPSTAPAALPILAMARAIAAVGAWPARPMTARSGAPNCRI